MVRVGSSHVSQCRLHEGERSEAVPTLTVMTHDSFKVSEKVVKDFEGTFDCKVTFLKAGDAGAALNQTILSKKNPWRTCFSGSTTPSWAGR